jgi:Fur family transcriptional regulator, ferric uptake regulator
MNKQEGLNNLLEQAKRVGLKLTNQRKVICEVFFGQTGHQSVEDILAMARGLDPKVSLATVYRTLKLLQGYGLAKSHNFQEGQSLYEPCFDQTDHHDHLICTKCDIIVEFVNQEIERLQERVAKAHGFVITNHKMELYGLCKSCQQ